jgi:hypothetical protein
MDNTSNGEHFETLALNEIFVGEKTVAKSSIYRVKVDEDDYIGKFMSSGLLIATGTGSTGWLYSACRYSEQNVHAALELLGHHGEPELVRIHLAEELSKETVFPCDTQKMYYFVREANAADTSG